jgi:hypothetical protein
LGKRKLMLPDPTAIMIEGSLEVTLPTIWIIWTDEKAKVGRVRE